MTDTPNTLLSRLAREDAGRVAVWDAQCDPPAPVSRGELWRRVAALGARLREHHVVRGDCIAVWLPNWSDAIVWQLAAGAVGAHVIGVNTRYGIDEVTHVLASARPKVVAIAHGFLNLDLAALLRPAVASARIPAPSVAVVSGPGEAPPDESARAAYDVGAGTWAPDPVAAGLPDAELTESPDELYVAFTTSGSTGRPKLAAHTVAAVAGHSAAVAPAGEWDESCVTMLVLPWSGTLAYTPGMAGLLSGGSVLMVPQFDEDRALRLMQSVRVTHLACADDVSGRIMSAWKRHPCALPAFRRLLIGDFYGESGEIAVWAERETPATAVGIYGSSEVFALTSFWTPRDELPRRHRGGGWLVTPGMEVRVADPGTDEPVTGQGELQLRGPNVVDAYLGDDGTIAASVRTADGWFRTGDLGTAPGDGSLDYLCRMGDSLRLRGFLVEPGEIEARLSEHADVARVKVVGLDAPGGTEAIAFVVPRPGSSPDAADLRAWCAASLARFKVPARVHFIDQMPMTTGTNGSKIRAAALRDLAKQLAGAAE